MTARSGITMVFNVDGMHCASCGLLIDDTVEEVPGVLSSSTDVRAARTVVTVADGASVDPVTIIKAISEAGYTARPDWPSPEGKEGS
jgi:copper chaperone